MFSVTPIEMSNCRVCGINIKVGHLHYLLFNVYMPCVGSLKAQEDFELVLAEIASCCNYLEHHAAIIGGDFNMDLSHCSSSHTRHATDFFFFFLLFFWDT